MKHFIIVRCGVLALLLAMVAAARAQTMVLRDAHLVDGSGVTKEHATVVIRDGKFLRVESRAVSMPGAQVIELQGKTVMPSLINGHGHLGLLHGTKFDAANYTRENVLRQLRQYQQYGLRLCSRWG